MGYFVTDATIRACIESGDFKRAEEMLNERIIEYSHELFTFFRNVLDEQTARICAEIFALMRDENMDKVLGVLEPISVAVEYWQEDERTRDEVLDRLNPEVREVVEAIKVEGKIKRGGQANELIFIEMMSKCEVILAPS